MSLQEQPAPEGVGEEEEEVTGGYQEQTALISCVTDRAMGEWGKGCTFYIVSSSQNGV